MKGTVGLKLALNYNIQVNLDKLVDKWAGSIEIGVTTNTPSELEFPSTMTNVRSGTWMMTGNGKRIKIERRSIV